MAKATAANPRRFLRWAVTLALVPACAQEPAVPTLKVTVTLVQLDAVVTDKHGKHVANLTRGDFEVFQDGKKQQITHFTYIPGLAPAATPRTAGTATPSGAKPQAEQIRRTIVLMVDDLGLSFSSAAYLREALRKYVREQVQPDELVAVLRTSGGSGAFQQFTTDPRVLTAAVDRLSWNVSSRTGISALPALGGGEDDTGEGSGAGPVRDRNQRAVLRTIGMLQYVTEGLRSMPGRKGVVLFSDGLVFRRVLGGHDADVRPIVEERFRRLVDRANRANVVISTVDTKGISYTGMQAKDNLGGAQAEDVHGLVQARAGQATEGWDGMIELARGTGGVFFHNTNDIGRAAQQAVEDLEGYYLIGFSPPDGTFKPDSGESKYHRVRVVVRRGGLQVRTRAGYFGGEDRRQAPQVPADPAAQLVKAALSPFTSGAIGLRLTALFANTAEAGSYVTSMLHIAGKDLTFSKQADGGYKAQVDVASFIYQDDGSLLDKRASSYTIRVANSQFETLLRNGFLYRLQNIVTRPGAYQVRAAVWDAGSGKLGSASQYLEVPNVEKGSLALSSVVMQSSVDDGAREAELAGTGSVAVRVFRPGVPIFYGFVVLNPGMKEGTSHPDVEIQATVLRDGQPVWKGPAFTLDAATPADPRRVKVAQKLSFGASTPPGEYLLHIEATSHRAGTKQKTHAEQSLDFELRRR
ncbi:MAG: VWA domain-containing protein [Bryobacterales bacterium]|nr:VWA domain-containing protein [Bryobacterales bacterium]